MITAIDCTPTWEAVLPMLLLVLKDGTTEGQKIAKEELRRMARAADQAVSMQKEAA